MADRIYGGDWEASALGPPSSWPLCLKSAVDIMLPAKAQIVIFWGQDFVALYNDAYAPTIGSKHPQALGRPARENWSELWGDLEPLLRRVLDHGETVAAKDRAFSIERHGYRETVHFDISYSPIRDEEGKVGGVFCIVSETTERVKFETELRESEDRFRAIFSQTAAGIGQSDLAGRLLLVNSRFCEIVGYRQAELQKLRVQDITFPRDLDDYVRSFRTMLETGQSFDIEKRYVRKDGSLVWVANSISPLRDTKGAIRQAVAVVVDITERKRAQEVERRLAAIIASSDDAILGTDLNMRITSWNFGAEKLYGYSAEEAIGRSVMLLVPDDRIEEEPAIIRQVNAGLRVAPYETKRRRKDGRLVDVLLSVSPIFDAYGRIVGASKIAHDISARKEAERLQSVLVGELNHRVKNVLATVMAIARQTLGREKANRAGVDAFEARLALMSRAHDLLTHGNWEQAELETVVRQSLSPYQQDRFSISGPSIQLAPRAVVSISLALHELATNALKYGALSTPEGRVSIEWSFERNEHARLRLQWRETGGPTVTAPSRKGFGSRLIESLLAAELKGEVTIAYDPAGVVCVVDAPVGGGWDHEHPVGSAQ
ncbi:MULTISPECIES: PAS domain S-box protein [unclassified Rhizobium]|uniref:PAS domain S-box protein n=1 Tax=unclassified Rhizobium TaxID=2613769 RepID=UPI00104D3BD8|nr:MULTISPECIES: PAS domain S-box protein [unclassified Rhizobium]MBB3393778.1 PAS domain S-box-containing protein [Rhizobium sp. BK060]MBB4166502.1 PAS domain S-box-containing protein [Rhizobium sp. BK538]TCM81622.1 PAS domain S-box-containing protein [Rhizobium sp. BK068]